MIIYWMPKKVDIYTHLWVCESNCHQYATLWSAYENRKVVKKCEKVVKKSDTKPYVAFQESFGFA